MGGGRACSPGSTTLATCSRPCAARQLDLRRAAIVGHGEGATLALSVAIGDPAISALTLIGPSARSWRDVLRRGVAERTRTGTDLEHPLVSALDRVSEEIIERAERREPASGLRVGGAGTRGAPPGRRGAGDPHPAAGAGHHAPSIGCAGPRWAGRVVGSDESELLAAALAMRATSLAGACCRSRPRSGGGGRRGVDEIAADLAARIPPVELPPVLLAIEEMPATCASMASMKPQAGDQTPRLQPAGR